MSSSSDQPATAPRATSVHVQVDRELLNQLDGLRALIQSSLRSTVAVTRGHVMRLALRRLVLSYLAHLSERGVSESINDDWHATVAAIHGEGTCPDWLLPGQPETSPPKPKKKGR